MNAESTIVELEKVLETIENLADQCARQLLRVDEVMDFVEGLRRKVTTMLQKDTPAYRAFDRMSRETTQWWDSTFSGYVAPKDCSHLDRWIGILTSTINELEPEFLREQKRPINQHFFREGEMRMLQRIADLSENAHRAHRRHVIFAALNFVER